jgi:hypothetical protein
MVTRTEDDYLRLTDAELVRRVWHLVALADFDDEEDHDHLCFALVELFERHVPEAEFADHVRTLEADCADLDWRLHEIESVRRSMRRREGARMILRAFTAQEGGPERG